MSPAGHPAADAGRRTGRSLLLRALIAVPRAAGRALYRLMRLGKARRKVVLLSRQSPRPSADFELLVAELRRREPELEIVVRCRMIGPGWAGHVAYLAEVLAQMRELATARVCVVDGYIIPVSMFEHGTELTVVQMWHALGAIKRFGLQSVGRSGGRPEGIAGAMEMHRRYDLVICGGPRSVPVFAEAFGVAESAVLPLGLPRVDRLRERDRRDTGTASGRRPTRVLYVPTFRRGRRVAYAEVIEAFGGEEYALVIKPHPLEPPPAASSGFEDASSIDVLDLIPEADVVITDYSAVAFEAAALMRRVYFYVPDISAYRDEVGLNMDPLLELPAIASEDIRRIERWVAAGAYPREDLIAFRDAFVASAERPCTERIADVIMERLEGPGMLTGSGRAS